MGQIGATEARPSADPGKRLSSRSLRETPVARSPETDHPAQCHTDLCKRPQSQCGRRHVNPLVYHRPRLNRRRGVPIRQRCLLDDPGGIPEAAYHIQNTQNKDQVGDDACDACEEQPDLLDGPPDAGGLTAYERGSWRSYLDASRTEITRPQFINR